MGYALSVKKISSIADVAVRKHHQQLDEVRITFTRTLSKSCLKKQQLCHATYTVNTQRNPVSTAYACALTKNARISQDTLSINACVTDRKTTLLIPV